MSATPRPWAAKYNANDQAWFVEGPDGHTIVDCIQCEDHPLRTQPDTWLIERAVNAFAALLAVAKAGATGGLPDLFVALENLEAAHPGWREWTP